MQVTVNVQLSRDEFLAKPADDLAADLLAAIGGSMDAGDTAVVVVLAAVDTGYAPPYPPPMIDEPPA